MLETLKQRWEAAEAGQKKLIAVLAVATLLTSLGGAMTLRTRGAMAPLYTGLPPTETREIAAELSRQGIAFKIAPDETAVSVPVHQEATARMRLAAAGLPRSAPEKGWEIFGEGGLAITDSQQRAMQIRALQGELARSIASLENVTKAAVHISLEKDSPFVEETEPAKAAVLLHLKPGGSIGRDQAMAIAHLVAKSVPDLETAQVTLLDEKGSLLFADNVARGSNGGEGTRDVEREIERRVQSQLDMTFGMGKTICRATAEVDTESAELRRKTYEPINNGREGVPSREVVETEDYEGAATRQVRGIPGAGTNVFQEQAAGEAEDGGNYNRSRSERDFLVNESEELRVQPGGGLRRLTLGIFVDESLNGDLSKIEAVARAAAGISADRGDTISVESVKFAATSTDGFQAVSRMEMIRTLARLVLNSLALLIGLLTLRSIVGALKPAPQSEHGYGEQELLDADTMLLTDGQAAVAADPARAGLPLLDTHDETDTPKLEQTKTVDELMAEMQDMEVDDVAEVVRHWLEGRLDEHATGTR